MSTTSDERELDRRLEGLPVGTPTAEPVRTERQPVHTVYGGAHLFAADSAPKLGRVALRALDAWAGDALTFARAIGLPGHDTLPRSPATQQALREQAEHDLSSMRATWPEAWLAATVYQRVRAKLEREPVEDFRIDFEDGYGHRGDHEEDGHAASAARAVAQGLEAGTLPPFIGIRIKALDRSTGRRGARTLDRFVSTLLAETGGRLPPGFVITLPKIGAPAAVTLLTELLADLEGRHGLAAGSLHMELMVETAASLIGADGRMALPSLVEAGDGRVVGAHFGVYDYTAEVGLAAAEQRMDHPACDLARGLMQIALVGTGVQLSDGATNIMPVPGTADNGDLDHALARRAQVHAGWHLHFSHVRRSLGRGFYQGWDLHPAQLPSRYAAVISFFLEGLDEATARLRTFVEQSARATLSGDIFDDAATGQGLLNVFLRGLACGAVTETEATATGLTLAELRTRSFQQILAGRTTQA